LALAEGIRVWDAVAETCVCQIALPQASSISRALRFAGEEVVVGVDRALAHFAIATGAAVRQDKVNGNVAGFCVLERGVSVCVLANKTLCAFNAQGEACSVGLAKTFRCECLASCQDWVCVGDDSGAVVLLQLVVVASGACALASTGQVLKSARVRGAVTSLAFGPSPHILFVGTSEGALLKWVRQE
jgi:hypothetical protein